VQKKKGTVAYMGDIDLLYNKEIKCPVCNNLINVTKVKQKGVKIANRDTDFCIYYEGINPIFYDAWVCENCGYAALSERFENISSQEASLVKSKITPSWKKRSFSGERSIDGAIEAFKIVLLNNKIRNSKASDNARVCMRLSWLFRQKKDNKEIDFLKHTAKYYCDAFDSERFPVGNLDEATCLYIIAELKRRSGDYTESMQWFSRLIGTPDYRNNSKILEMAREQYAILKESVAHTN
jgi:uncharacterized protein (DUF2225 family)